MRKNYLKIVYVLVIITLLFLEALAQTETIKIETFEININEDFAPLDGVKIYIKDSLFCVTNEHGEAVKIVTPGYFEAEARKDGFIPFIKRDAIERGGVTKTVKFFLKRSASVTISTNVIGAFIYVDGIEKGK